MTPEQRGPLALGVVGHRDVPTADLPRLRSALESFLSELVDRAPPAGIEVITGLAEGADLLVADVAASLGIPVRAVVPMPMETYRGDFSRAGLAQLERLAASRGVEVSELPAPPGVDPEAARSPGTERDRLYAALGDHLAGRADLLLALWDGAANGKPGGTGAVVLTYLGADAANGPYAGPIVMEDADGGTADGTVVAWLPVRRSEEVAPPEASIVFLTAGSGVGRLRRWSRLPPHVLDGPPRSAGLLGGMPDGVDPELRERLATIDAAYARTDGLAMANQRRSEAVFKVLALVAAGMGTLFLLYAKVRPLDAFLIGYLTLMVGGYALFTVAHRAGWFTRHLANRVAAESLRVRFYLTLAGVDQEVDTRRLQDITGVDRLRGFGSVREAAGTGEAVGARRAGADEDRHLDAVRRMWIEDQAAYFHGRSERLRRRHHILERLRSALFIVAFLAGLVLLLFPKDLAGVELTTDVNGKTLVLLAMGFLPALVGLWELYQNKLATRELMWQYRNQAEHFSRAAAALDDASSADERRRVLVDLGERSLFEVYLWSLHRFHREFEASIGG